MIRAKQAWDRLFEIRKKIDLSGTESSSQLKEIFNRIHFADIESEKQNIMNQGTILFKEYEDEQAKFFGGMNLSYIIVPNTLGIVYANVEQTENKKGERKTKFNYQHANGYVKFLGDLIAGKVIYHSETNSFLKITATQYEGIRNDNFFSLYPVDRKQMIGDFYESIQYLFKEGHVTYPTDAVVHLTKIAGTDWIYDCEKMELIQTTIQDNHHYNLFFDVLYKEINVSLAQDFLKKIIADDFSLHNARLLHAYTLFRRMNLIHPEKFFIIKDGGRTGKGLLIATFQDLFKYRQISYDALTGNGFDAQNEWLNFIDVELAHANESGEIGLKQMRILRKIATGETVIGRAIGENSTKIKLGAVLVIDTNEKIEIGELTANKSRAVKIAFKDRPKDETDQMRHAFFEPFWNFIQPNGETATKASVSFLIASLNYLKSQKQSFVFHDAVLKNYFSADDLTETQKILLLIISSQGFILSADETLRMAIREDYGSIRNPDAKKDIRAIGVKLNKAKRVDGQVVKVHVAGDKGLFNSALELVLNEELL